MFDIIFSIIVLLFSIAMHEAAHGFAAYKLGDPTAKYAGRLSLNPLKHMDPIGSFIFPLLTLLATGGRGPAFGWAKPVPINPYNFSDQKWGKIKVAVAGPLVNFIIALISGLMLRLIPASSFLFPILITISLMNLSLCVFNLLPFPPLDGGHVVLGLLPESMHSVKVFLERYGFFILLMLMLSGANIVSPLVLKIFYLVIGSGF